MNIRKQQYQQKELIRPRASPIGIQGTLHLVTTFQKTWKGPKLACKAYLNFACYTAETVAK